MCNGSYEKSCLLLCLLLEETDEVDLAVKLVHSSESKHSISFASCQFVNRVSTSYYHYPGRANNHWRNPRLLLNNSVCFGEEHVFLQIASIGGVQDRMEDLSESAKCFKTDDSNPKRSKPYKSFDQDCDLSDDPEGAASSPAKRMLSIPEKEALKLELEQATKEIAELKENMAALSSENRNLQTNLECVLKTAKEERENNLFTLRELWAKLNNLAQGQAGNVELSKEVKGILNYCNWIAYQLQFQAGHQEPVDSSWIYNDLVLDAVFSFLSVPDLKQVKLTCRQFNKVGGRALAKRAVVYLTSQTFAGSKMSVVNVPWETIPERDSERVKRTHRYSSVDHQMFAQVADRSPDFRPKRISLLGCDSAYKLPSCQFATTQELHVTAYDQLSGIELLHNVASLFPNLTSLTMCDIKPESWAEVDKCRCMFCGFFRHDQMSDTVAIPSTSASNQEYRLSVDQIARAEKLPLKKLHLEVTPHCLQGDWEILRHFRQLEAIQIDWWTAKDRYVEPQNPMHARYEDFLEKVFPYMLNFSNLSHLSLRFEFKSPDYMVVQTVLNQLQLHKISLSIGDSSCFYPDLTLLNFLSGLQNHVVEALDSLYFMCFHGGCESMESKFRHIFSLLSSNNFFHKPRWTLKFGCWHFSKSNLYLVTKTARTLVVQQQMQFDAGPNRGFDTFLANYFEGFVVCNYAVHRAKSQNYMEILNPNAISSAQLRWANWMEVPDLTCDTCLNLPRLVCDLPGFREEANIGQGHDESNDSIEWDSSWTFYSIPPHILSKWDLVLDSKIQSILSGGKACFCLWWKRMAEFGRKYPGCITDISGGGSQNPYNAFSDPTMSSCGYQLRK